MADTPAASGRKTVNPWLIALTVSIATFMEVLDTSIANVALRYIAGSLAAGLDESTWVLTSYLVSNAIVLPLSGWLSERMGRKRFYMTCVAIFTVSSFMCGIAPSLAFLLVARVFQGAGGGGLAPSEQAILTDTFPAEKRGQAFALYGIAVVVAPAIGPTLGGWLTDTYNWRWIFFINVPVGILSLTLTHFLVPADEESNKNKNRAGKRIDYLGFGLIALGLGCLQVVLDRGQIDDWFGSRLITIFSIVSVSCLALLIIHELTVQDPVVDLPLLAKPSFFFANVIMFLFGAILFGTTQLIPQLVQNLLGYTATLAGLTLSPGGVAVFILLPFVGWLLSKTQPKYLIAFGFLVTALALRYMERSFTVQASFGMATFARCFQAVGLAFLFVPINTIAYSGLPPGKSNDASALINLMRNLGGSVGISVSQTMIDRRSQFHQNRLSGHMTPLNLNYWNALHGWNPMQTNAGPPSASQASRSIGALYGELGRQASLMSYLDVFHVMSIASFCTIVLVMFLRRIKAGEESQAH
ncbi:MAG TPA: DHA2 family efflux MFS transporter permease subunit [Tepidisphaeraceae bacterium]|jgi:DHA2 family multidrug resistance protein|nr:DHA2 family efflux MFS transporter permease subunit [Tepidisphaeraceae bacterium]